MLNFNGLPSFDDQTHPASLFFSVTIEWYRRFLTCTHHGGWRRKWPKKPHSKCLTMILWWKIWQHVFSWPNARWQFAFDVNRWNTFMQQRHRRRYRRRRRRRSQPTRRRRSMQRRCTRHGVGVECAYMQKWISWKKRCCDGFVFAIVALKAGKNGHGWCFCCKFLHLKVSFVNCLCERCILMLQKRSAIVTWNIFSIYCRRKIRMWRWICCFTNDCPKLTNLVFEWSKGAITVFHCIVCDVYQH